MAAGGTGDWANLLVLLRAVGQQHPLGLHVPIEHTLQGRHVALDDVFHLWVHAAVSQAQVPEPSLSDILGPGL